MSAFSVEATIRLRDLASKDVKGLNKTLSSLFKTVQKLNAAPAAGIVNAADGLAALQSAYVNAAKGAARFAQAGLKVERTLGAQTQGARDAARAIRAMVEGSRRLNASQRGSAGAKGILGDQRATLEARAAMDRLAGIYGKAAAGADRLARSVGAVNAALAQQAGLARTVRGYGAVWGRSPEMAPGGVPYGGRPGYRRGRGYQTPMEAAGHSLSYGIVNSARGVVGSGGWQAVDADKAKAGLSLKGLDAGKVAEVMRAAETLTKEFRAVPMGDMIEALGDAMLQAKDAAGFKDLARNVASNAQLFSIARGSTDEGKRAAQTIGKIVDALGKADEPKQAAEYSQAIAKAVIQNGKDTALPTTLALVRGLKDAKFGQSPEGLAKIISLGDEMGQRVGNSAAQLQAFLSGSGKASSRAELGKLGFLDGKGRFTGRDKAGSDLLKWVIDDFAPALQKRGIDTTSGSAINEYLRGTLKTKDTIADVLATTIAKADEIRRGEAQRRNMDTSPRASSGLTDKSLAASAEAVRASFGGLSDAVVSKVTPALLGLGTSASTALQNAADTVRKTEISDPAMVGAGAAAGAALLGAKAKLIKRIAGLFPGGLGGLSGIAGTVGRVALKGAGGIGAATTAMEGFTSLLRQASDQRTREKASGTELGKLYAAADARRAERAERSRAIVRNLGDQATRAVTGSRLPSLAATGSRTDPLAVSFARSPIWGGDQQSRAATGFALKSQGWWQNGAEGETGSPHRRGGLWGGEAPKLDFGKFESITQEMDATTAKIAAAIDAIPGKGGDFGSKAGASLAAVASSIGSTIGQAAASAFNSSARVSTPPATPTGAHRP